MDVGFWIMNVLFLAPWLYALFLCIELLWDNSVQEPQRRENVLNEYYACGHCGERFFERLSYCPYCGHDEFVAWPLVPNETYQSLAPFASHVPQAGDGGAGAGQRGNGGAGQLWTFYGTGQSCRCSEHCLELSCDHGRMRFVKCYVCGSDWLIPAVKPNPMTTVKTAKMPTKWENGKRGRIPEESITVLL